MSIISFLWGRKRWQFVFQRLYKLALIGLNYNRASDYQGNGERWLMERVVRWSNNRPVVVMDVGANVGNYSAALLELFRERPLQLFCFEPSASTFAELQKKLAGRPQARLFNTGMSSQPGTTKLFSKAGASGLSSVYQRDLSHRETALDVEETIELDSLDHFCTIHGIQEIDVLKMDVEGHEVAVLQGANRLLTEKRIKLIQFEFGGCNIDSRTYFRDFFHLLNPNFRLFRLLADGLQPIDRYNESLEVFQSANYVALRRDLALRDFE